MYSDAQEVLVWLGEATVKSDIAMDFVEYVALMLGLVETNPSPHRNLYGRVSRIYPQDSEIFLECALNTLRELSKRPYWSRAWIIKEVLHAQNITLYCGWKTVSWQKLGQAYDLI